jgi:hypothetical protein
MYNAFPDTFPMVEFLKLTLYPGFTLETQAYAALQEFHVIVGAGGPKFEKREIKETAAMARCCPSLWKITIDGEMDVAEATRTWTTEMTDWFPIERQEHLAELNSALTYRLTCQCTEREAVGWRMAIDQF